MPKATHTDLGRRERQIMDIVYSLGSATAAEVLERLPDAPSYSAVRGMLRYLEDKGLLRHEEDGRRYVFYPTTARDKASRTALQHLIKTFFGGSRARTMAALLDVPDAQLSEAQMKALRKAIADAGGQEG